MRLNTITHAPGAKQTKKRLGRGIGSGLGKTSGRGHKGQRARAGGFHKLGFEGGQMPIQRRLPKFGFSSRKARVTTEIRLDILDKLASEIINLDALLKANIINGSIKDVKVIGSGKVSKSVRIEGLRVTEGARKAIESAGGSVK